MNNENKPKKVIRNPYARKKPAAAPKPPPPAPQPAATAAVRTTARRVTQQFVATTFSQAFGDYDNHDTNDNNVGDNSVTTTTTTTRPTVTTAAATTTTAPQHAVDAVAHQSLTDRESHVLLTSNQQPHVLYVSPKQQGNAVLQYIRNVPTATARMVPDFILSATRCALFLSCKYHALYPQYIHGRIAELGQDFELRILLVLVDVQDNTAALRQLNKLAVVNNLTLLLAWTAEEAARYLETLKAFDGKDATLIQKRQLDHFADQVTDFLTACRTVNKTDSANLMAQFGSMAALSPAGPDDLALVAGMGQVKVKRLYEAWHKPFSSQRAKRRKKEREQLAAETQALVEAKAVDAIAEEDEGATKEQEQNKNKLESNKTT